MNAPAKLSPAAVLALLRSAGIDLGRASGRVRDQRAGVTARKVTAWRVAIFAPSAEAARQCANALTAAGLTIGCADPNFRSGCFQVSRPTV